MTPRIQSEIDPRYSSPGAHAPDWTAIAQALTDTEIYALTTILPDGSPHTVPVAGAWNEEGFWFCTGEYEQKARNITHSSRGSVHIGGTDFSTGMDINVRGEIVQAIDDASLTMLADALAAKYPEFFRFTVTDGALLNAHGNRAAVYCIRPEVAHVHTRGDSTVQARYTFDRS